MLTSCQALHELTLIPDNNAIIPILQILHPYPRFASSLLSPVFTRPFFYSPTFSCSPLIPLFQSRCLTKLQIGLLFTLQALPTVTSRT